MKKYVLFISFESKNDFRLKTLDYLIFQLTYTVQCTTEIKTTIIILKLRNYFRLVIYVKIHF